MNPAIENLKGAILMLEKAIKLVGRIPFSIEENPDVISVHNFLSQVKANQEVELKKLEWEAMKPKEEKKAE